jgi:transcriptional regulator with XRE-family HTH domain
MDEASSGLGMRMRGERQRRNLTQEALAERSGVSARMVASVEQGRRTPTLPVLEQLARALGVPVSGLVGNPDGALTFWARDLASVVDGAPHARLARAPVTAQHVQRYWRA